MKELKMAGIDGIIEEIKSLSKLNLEQDDSLIRIPVESYNMDGEPITELRTFKILREA